MTLLLGAQAFGQTSEAEADESSGIESSDSDDESTDDATPEETTFDLHVGGALRFTYNVKSWDDGNLGQGGEFIFDTFRINVDGSYGPVSVSAEWRFYAGYQFLHHGYLGYTFSPNFDLQLGVSRVPFGILPYASHSWFFNIPYYVGLEDDYDLGLKALMTFGDLDLQLAFYKRDEGNYLGSSIDSARFSYDVVRTDAAELGDPNLNEAQGNNSERNQVNARIAYQLRHANDNTTEIGVSGQWGQLYNATTDANGSQWAAAAHIDGHWGRFNLQLQGSYYENRPDYPAGVNDTFVAMGAYDAPYKVASRAFLGVAGLSYFLPVALWPLDSFTFYNDFSYMLKPEEGFADTLMNVTGILVAIGPVYTYIDVAAAKNHPWIGGDWVTGLAEGDDDAEWEIRFNINFGIYF